MGRDLEIRIYLLQPTATSAGIICPLLKVIKLYKNNEGDFSSVIINLKWIDEHHLLALTSNEVFHLLEVQKGIVLASQKIIAINLVYNTADFKVNYINIKFSHKKLRIF